MRSTFSVRLTKVLSTLCAAVLCCGLIPTTALAEQSLSLIPEGEQGAVPIVTSGVEGGGSDVLALRSDDAPSADGDGAVTSSENVNDMTDDVDAVVIPAANERINETKVLQTRTVAQVESTRTYFLAQTLESTRTVPIVSANLPLDTGSIDVVEPDAEGEGGDEFDDPDSEGELNYDVISTGNDNYPSHIISTEANDSERNGEISAASTVIGSFTYRGITYAVEPGGESVAVVAADYAKFPEEFIEAQIIALPSVVAVDNKNIYSVTRIADYAFAGLSVEAVSRSVTLGKPEASKLNRTISAEIDSIAEDVADFSDQTALIPASITCIEDAAFVEADAIRYVVVSEDNPRYSSYDGCLYDADQLSLLLIPEGRRGPVRIPSSLAQIPENASLRGAHEVSLIVEQNSTASRCIFDEAFKTRYLEVIFDEGIQTEYELKWSTDPFALGLWEESCAESAAGIMQLQRALMNGADDLVAPSGWTIRGRFDARNYTSYQADLYSAPVTLGNAFIGAHTDTSVGVASGLTSASRQGEAIRNPASIRSFENTMKNSSVFHGISMGGSGSAVSASSNYGFVLRYSPSVGFYVNEQNKNAKLYYDLILYQHINGWYVGGMKCDTAVVLQRNTPAKRHEVASEFGFEWFNNNDIYYADYAVILYGSTSVSLTLNGGLCDNVSDGAAITASSPFELPDPIRENCVFFGWSVDTPTSARALPGVEENDRDLYDAGTRFAIRDDTTFTANWGNIVTWEGNNGVGDIFTTTELVDSRHVAPSFARVGYALEGWYTGQDGAGTKVAEPDGETFEPVSEHATYYANWDVDSYTVKWQDSNGSKLYEDGTTSYTDAISFPAPSREGHRFTGWKAEVNGETYTASSVDVSELVTGVGFEGPIVFTATWEHADYMFELKDAGYGLNTDDIPSSASSLGSFTVSTSKTLTQGAAAQFAMKEPTRKGYDFVGFYWHPGQSDECAFYVSDSEYVDVSAVTDETNTSWWSLPCFKDIGDGTKMVTLEAVWQPVVYTITWDYNWREEESAYVYLEDGLEKAPVTTTVAYGAALEVPSVIDPGYGFIGWKGGKTSDGATTARPSVTFSDGSADATLASYSSDWFQKKGSQVLFKPSESATLPARDSIRFYAYFSDTPTVFSYRVYLSRPGTGSHGSFTVNPSALKTDEAGRTYYADRYEYGIGVNLASLATDGNMISWDDGWTLLGFSQDASSDALASVDKKATGTQVFYAVWSADEFSVALSLDTLEDGESYIAPEGAALEDGSAYAFGYDAEDDALMATFPTPTGAIGYHFRGWRLLGADGSFVEGAPVVSGIPSVKDYIDALFADGLADSFAHATYGAVWEPYSYNLYFHTNRSATDDECSVVRAFFGEDVELPAPYTKRSGFIFRVWQPTAGQYMERFGTWRSYQTVSVEQFVKRYAEVTGAAPALDPEASDDSFRIDLYANWAQPVSADVALTVNILLDPWNPYAEGGRGKVIANDSNVNGGEAFKTSSGALVNAWVGTDKDYTDGSFPGGGAYALRIEALTYLPAGDEAGDAVTTSEVFTKTNDDGTRTDASDGFTLQLYAGGKKGDLTDRVLEIPLSSGRLELPKDVLVAYGLDATIKKGSPLHLYYDLDLGAEMTLERYEKLLEIIDRQATRADGTTYRLSHPIAHFYYTIGLVPVESA